MIDPENPVAQICAAGMAIDGDPRAAHALFVQAWESRRDDYDASIAAHFLARHQPSPADALHWNRLAAAHAEAVPDDRAKPLLASLYLNLADSQHVVRPLRYAINVTLDGCCDHRAIIPDEALHRHHLENITHADALLFGRVTYEMMEAGWRRPVPAGSRPDWMEPFARTIDAAKKYVVSSTLERVDWNAELVRGDLETAVRQLKRQPGKGLLTGGLRLPLALAELGLIDEYEFLVQPRLVGHGPTLFAGLSKYVDLKLVSRKEFDSGAVLMRYEPSR